MFATLRANLTALSQPQKKLAIVAAGVLAVICYAAGSLGSGGGSAGSGGVSTFAASAKPAGADAKIAVSLPQIYVALAGAVKRPGVYQLVEQVERVCLAGSYLILHRKHPFGL